MTLRLAPAVFARLDAAALGLGVETGALIREAALTGLEETVCRVRAGEVRLRGRSGLASSEVAKSARAGEQGASAVVQAPAVVGVRELGALPSASPADLPVGVRRAIAFRRAVGRL